MSQSATAAYFGTLRAPASRAKLSDGPVVHCCPTPGNSAGDPRVRSALTNAHSLFPLVMKYYSGRCSTLVAIVTPESSTNPVHGIHQGLYSPAHSHILKLAD